MSAPRTPRKFDAETRAQAVGMYVDRLRDHGGSKAAARKHVGALLEINPATLRHWVERNSTSSSQVDDGGAVPATEPQHPSTETAQPGQLDEVLTGAAENPHPARGHTAESPRPAAVDHPEPELTTTAAASPTPAPTPGAPGRPERSNPGPEPRGATPTTGPTVSGPAGPVPAPTALPAPPPRRWWGARRTDGRSPEPAPEPTPPGQERDHDPAVRRSTRLLGVDAARGLALLGMMAVHALYVTDQTGNPVWWAELAEGPSAALFALLAGVGVAFSTGRARVRLGRPAPAAAASLVTRAVLIGAVGLALGYTDAAVAAVILPYYAVLFILAIPLLFLGRAALLVTGLGLAVAVPFWSHHLRATLPLADGNNPGFTTLVHDPLGLLTELVLTGYYPALAWTAYLAVGLAIGRMTLSSAPVAAGLLGVGATLAAAASTASGLLLGPGGGLARIQQSATATAMNPDQLREFLTSGPDGTTPPTTLWWLAVDTAHSSTPLDLLHTIGVASAVLGAMLLLGHLTAPGLRTAVTAIRAPLVAAGAMTLTFYTAHIVFLNSPFDTYPPATGYLLQVLVALGFGLAWRATAGRGPLERLVTAATHAAVRATRIPEREPPVSTGNAERRTGLTLVAVALAIGVAVAAYTGTHLTAPPGNPPTVAAAPTPSATAPPAAAAAAPVAPATPRPPAQAPPTQAPPAQAPPAQAPPADFMPVVAPDPQDVAFGEALTKADLDLGSIADRSQLGRGICRELDTGTPIPQLADGVQTLTQTSRPDTAYLLRAAATVYCPLDTPKLPPG